MTDAAHSEPPSGIRKARCVCLDVIVDATSEHTLWADLALEIEHGGVFVATYRALSIGTVVELHVSLPDEEEPVTVSGVVRWTRAHLEGSDGSAGLGIKFVDLSADARARFARFAESVREPMIFELDDAPMRKRRRSVA